MGTKNGFGNAQLLGIIGGLASIISVFLPWYRANSNGMMSSISVNGLASISGNGILLGLWGKNANWEFQGMGIIALGIASIAISMLLRNKIHSIALVIIGILIIGGGAVNIWSIGELSGDFMGTTIEAGAGYGLYAVILTGLVSAAGGLLAWKDLP